jgi:hypothetical protein
LNILIVYEAQKYSRNIPNAIAGAILYKKARQLWQKTWLADNETGVMSTINGQLYCLVAVSEVTGKTAGRVHLKQRASQGTAVRLKK